MYTLTSFFVLGSIVSGCFWAWLHTKSGKKWLKEFE